MSFYANSSDVSYLSSQLSNPDVEGDVFQMRKVMMKVIGQMTRGVDVSSLFPKMVKLMASSDLIIKKLACWFVTRHANQPDILLLAINTLLRDCQDPNPMVRGLALKTLSCLRQPTLIDYCIQPITTGLQDRSAYVRRAAIVACVKVHHQSPQVIHDHDIIDQLYSMIRDQDPVVVTNALNALEEILNLEGGIVINRNIAYYLLNKVGMFTEWGLTLVFNLLKRYHPKSEEEVFDIMNLIDNYLKHSNSAVVVATLEYFLYLIKDMPHLKGEVMKRAKSTILHFIDAGHPELSFMLLTFMDGILSSSPDMVQRDYKTWFCKYNEPVYVKLKKIKAIPLLVTENNLEDIIDELSMYSADVTPVLAKEAINAIGIICMKLPVHFDKCVKKLISLLQLKIDFVTSEVLGVLTRLDFQSKESLQEVMSYAPDWMDLVYDNEGKCALLWLLGEYGEYHSDSPYLLETYIDGIIEETSSPVKLHLLTATVKLFLKRPAECQDMLGTLFEACMQENNTALSDRVHFYYNLLQADVHNAKRVVCGN